MNGIASFRPGIQNGEPYSADQLHAAVENYHKFSAGDPPHYVPYLSLNHDDHLAFGDISGARMSGDTLMLDGKNIPLPVKSLVENKQLRQPSIEFFLPRKDPATGAIVDGFRDQNGQVVTTPVIKCLTLLGNLPPAVKGLPPLSSATFAAFTHAFHDAPPAPSFGGVVRRFSGETTMDRPAMLAALTAAGVDTSAITEQVPDEVLMAFLAAIQKAAQPAPDVPPAADMGNPMVAANADDTATTGATPTLTVPQVSGGNPSAITVKFTDLTGAAKTVPLGTYLAGLDGQLKSLAAQTAADTKFRAAQATEAKKGLVKRFLDELAADPAGARMLPAQRPDIEAMLLTLDHTATAKFTSDGKPEPTALEARMASMRGWAVVKKFGDQLAATVPAKASVTADRRSELLAKTPEGRAVLKREAAATAM